MKPYNIFVVVQPGLEDVAHQELNYLGYKDLSRIKGGFFLKGHLTTLMKINLACRSITRVLIEIAQFEARNFAVLEKEFNSILWQNYLADQNICIHVISYESKLYHEKAIAERLINSLSVVLHKPIVIVNSPDDDDTQLIVVYVKHDLVTIRLDSTGKHLHKRGFGTHKEDAPLRETVAAAMLYAAGWTGKSGQLTDPMCGSGTIAIEAALMLKQALWSEYRTFSFQSWKDFQPDLFKKTQQQLLLSQTEQSQTTVRYPPITATDISSNAILSAKVNAYQAGVDTMLQIKQQALDKVTVDKDTIIVTNPPWGKRLSINEIKQIWDILYICSKTAQTVCLTLPEEQKDIFPYPYKTLLVFKAGEIKIRYIRIIA